MEKVIKKLFFKLLRILNNGIPTPNEVEFALKNYTHSNSIRQVMGAYLKGASISEIALNFNVPRERIRQILFKGCRKIYETTN